MSRYRPARASLAVTSVAMVFSWSPKAYVKAYMLSTSATGRVGIGWTLERFSRAPRPPGFLNRSGCERNQSIGKLERRPQQPQQQHDGRRDQVSDGAAVFGPRIVFEPQRAEQRDDLQHDRHDQRNGRNDGAPGPLAGGLEAPETQEGEREAEQHRDRGDDALPVRRRDVVTRCVGCGFAGALVFVVVGHGGSIVARGKSAAHACEEK